MCKFERSPYGTGQRNEGGVALKVVGRIRVGRSVFVTVGGSLDEEKNSCVWSSKAEGTGALSSQQCGEIIPFEYRHGHISNMDEGELTCCSQCSVYFQLR